MPARTRARSASRRAVTRRVGTPRCAARSQIEATIAPFLCDQQWGDRGDQGCFRPQTIGTGGRPDWACRERTYKSPGRGSFFLIFLCFLYDLLCNPFFFGANPPPPPPPPPHKNDK